MLHFIHKQLMMLKCFQKFELMMLLMKEKVVVQEYIVQYAIFAMERYILKLQIIK